MMDYHELIDALNKETYWLGSSQPYSRDVHPVICDAAIEMLERLHSELATANARCETLDKLLAEYQDELVPGYRERAEAAERERDAAVEQLRRCDNRCDYCRYRGECRLNNKYVCDAPSPSSGEFTDYWAWNGGTA